MSACHSIRLEEEEGEWVVCACACVSACHSIRLEEEEGEWVVCACACVSACHSIRLEEEEGEWVAWWCVGGGDRGGSVAMVTMQSLPPSASA